MCAAVLYHPSSMVITVAQSGRGLLYLSAIVASCNDTTGYDNLLMWSNRLAKVFGWMNMLSPENVGAPIHAPW